LAWRGRERERERESGGAQCRARCGLILFSILRAQHLEAPEGSPARSLDARALIPADTRWDGGESNRASCTRSAARSGGSRRPPPVSVCVWEGGECVAWWVGLRRSGRLGTRARLPGCSGACGLRKPHVSPLKYHNCFYMNNLCIYIYIYMYKYSKNKKIFSLRLDNNIWCVNVNEIQINIDNE